MANELMETGEVEFFGVDFTPSKIVINNEDELTKTIEDYAAKYKGLVVNEEDVNDAKKVRAEMRGVAKSLDDKRKEVKKEYNKPLALFEKRIKKLTETIQEVITPIDEGIKNLEERERLSKQKEIETQVTILLEEQSDYIKESFLHNPKWLNKTVAMKKVAEEVAEQIKLLQKEEQQIKANEDIITNYCKAVKVEPQGWLSVLKNGNTAPEVMKMIDKSLADAKEREQAEIDRKQREEELARIKQDSYVELSVENIQETPYEPDFTDLEEPEVQTYHLEVTGTIDQLSALNSFMVDNGIKVKSV
ncbi:MAG: DUF1351 domain-containing protein [Carnobacterium inhibens]|uniref:DUF1351 domain-containing protein n=1 Tax=Carnobacterium sp. TaxID=48221 RepID=UPI003315BD19